MSAPSEKSPERFSANQLDTIMKDAKNKFIKVIFLLMTSFYTEFKKIYNEHSK